MNRLGKPPDGSSWWRQRTGWCRRLWLEFQRPILRRRLRRPVLECVDGVPLLVLPGVLNPVIFRSGTLLVRTLAGLPAADSSPAPHSACALDLGTGSGIGAIFAARRGYQAIGIDINPEAVRCARINVLLNRLEPQVEIRHGDLFAGVAGQQFDLVLFNPPFFVGQPRDAGDMAWRSRDVLERFARELPPVLKPTGLALVVLSSHGSPERMLDVLRQQPVAIEVVANRDFGNEIMHVYSVRRSRSDDRGDAHVPQRK